MYLVCHCVPEQSKEKRSRKQTLTTHLIATPSNINEHWAGVCTGKAVTLISLMHKLNEKQKKTTTRCFDLKYLSRPWAPHWGSRLTSSPGASQTEFPPQKNHIKVCKRTYKQGRLGMWVRLKSNKKVNTVLPRQSSLLRKIISRCLKEHINKDV